MSAVIELLLSMAANEIERIEELGDQSRLPRSCDLVGCVGISSTGRRRLKGEESGGTGLHRRSTDIMLKEVFSSVKYVCSDLHGRYDRWSALLEKIDLRPSDTFYVLGNVIDRGPDGCKILLDMMGRPNVIPILGNHEFTAAVCLPWLLEEVTDRSLAELDDTRLAALQDWIANGGGLTLRGLQELSRAEREDILDYLREMELYAEVEVGGRSFVLTHAGLDHFSPEKPLEDYELEDFLFCRPRPSEAFWPDRYLVYGHTTTRLLRAQIGRPLSDDILPCGQQIAIDCGCGFNGKLECICLDTMEVLYVE